MLLGVDDVTSIIENSGIKYTVVGREELHRGIIQDKDLIVAVGGDGTILNTSSFLDDTIPLLGINSDPRRPEVKLRRKQKLYRNLILIAFIFFRRKV